MRRTSVPSSESSTWFPPLGSRLFTTRIAPAFRTKNPRNREDLSVTPYSCGLSVFRHQRGLAKVSDRFFPEPALGRVIRRRQFFRQRHRRRVQSAAASSDQPQRPAHAFLDEVALVGGGALDQFQTGEIGRVVFRSFVVK